MRKIIAAVFIFLSVITYSQWSNTFSEKEGDAVKSTPKVDETEPGYAEYINQSAELDDENPPNPGDPIPIDDYIPLLLMVAAGLIIYKTYHRKSLSRWYLKPEISFGFIFGDEAVYGERGVKKTLISAD